MISPEWISLFFVVVGGTAWLMRLISKNEILEVQVKDRDGRIRELQDENSRLRDYAKISKP